MAKSLATKDKPKSGKRKLFSLARA
jgi:hypothetical protein